MNIAVVDSSSPAGGAPAATGKVPFLTPIAAGCLAVEGVLIAGLHYSYAEYSPLTFGLVLAGLEAFVSYGRLVLQPVA